MIRLATWFFTVAGATIAIALAIATVTHAWRNDVAEATLTGLLFLLAVGFIAASHFCLRRFGDTAKRVEVYKLTAGGSTRCGPDEVCSEALPPCGDYGDPNAVRGIEWPRRLSLNMKLHMLLMAICTVGGAAAGFWFGFAVMDRSVFWFIAGAVIGGHAPMLLFMFVVPARCPDCRQRLRVGVVGHEQQPTATTPRRSVYRPVYSCGVCGYRCPAA